MEAPKKTGAYTPFHPGLDTTSVPKKHLPLTKFRFSAFITNFCPLSRERVSIEDGKCLDVPHPPWGRRTD